MSDHLTLSVQMSYGSGLTRYDTIPYVVTQLSV